METLHQSGEVIAQKYRIVAPLGRGGIGTTYEAEDLTNYKRVAIKALSLRDITEWKVLELFEREAKVLANLNHPAIPKYLDYFHADTPDNRHFYLVQELVSAFSLADLVQKGWRADESKVKQIAIQVLEILNYLHSLTPPVIHRDIKPENIIGRQDGKAFLVDFGAVQDVYRRTVTRGSTFVGTLGYMPLEQFRGQVGAVSDLYSLGATLLFLLTHKSPDDLPQNRMKIDFRPQVNISNQFADWLEKMLEPAMEDRFPSASVALAALRSKGEHTQSLVQKRDRPKGSSIVLKKTDKTLVVEIPSYLHTSAFLMLIPFGGIMSSFSGMPLESLISTFIIFGTIFSVLFLLVFFTQSKLYYYLKINKNDFCLRWKLLCFSGSVKGKTADIKQVKVDINRSSKGIKTSECVLYEQERRHDFGRGITEVEQNWLVAEILDFLKQMHR